MLLPPMRLLSCGGLWGFSCPLSAGPSLEQHPWLTNSRLGTPWKPLNPREEGDTAVGTPARGGTKGHSPPNPPKTP
jgi:hypothetical protein